MSAPRMCGLQGFELFSNRRRLRRIRRDFHELLPEREPALDVLLHVEPDAPEAEEARGVRRVLAEVLLESGHGGLHPAQVEIGDREMIACVEVLGVEANRLLEPPQTILVSARLHVEAPDLGANGGVTSVFARLRLESLHLFLVDFADLLFLLEADRRAGHRRRFGAGSGWRHARRSCGAEDEIAGRDPEREPRYEEHEIGIHGFPAKESITGAQP